MAPLPQMSEQAMQCFRQKRLEAQNGSINPTVYAVVTAKDVLLFRILLKDSGKRASEIAASVFTITMHRWTNRRKPLRRLPKW